MLKLSKNNFYFIFFVFLVVNSSLIARDFYDYQIFGSSTIETHPSAKLGDNKIIYFGTFKNFMKEQQKSNILKLDNIPQEVLDISSGIHKTEFLNSFDISSFKKSNISYFLIQEIKNSKGEIGRIFKYLIVDNTKSFSKEYIKQIMLNYRFTSTETIKKKIIKKDDKKQNEKELLKEILKSQLNIVRDKCDE